MEAIMQTKLSWKLKKPHQFNILHNTSSVFSNWFFLLNTKGLQDTVIATTQSKLNMKIFGTP